VRGVRYVEVDQIGAPLGGVGAADFFYEIAVRVEQGESVPRLEIGAHKGLEKRRLSGAGLPDEIHVGEAVGLPDAEEPSVVAKVRSSE